MGTVRDLVNRSFRFIHVLGANETLTTDESSDALVVLNELIEQVNIDKLLGYYKTEIVFPFVAGQIVYTVGPSSTTPNVTAPRPVEILSAFSRRDGNDLPIHVADKQDYDSMQFKTASVAGWAQMVYYEPTWPKGTLTFYMKPLDTLTEVHLTVAAEIPTYATLDDTVSLPPGYTAWLKHKLGERLCPEYGMEFTLKMQEILVDSEAAIKKNNIKPMPISGTGLVGLGDAGGKYNIYSDISGRGR